MQTRNPGRMICRSLVTGGFVFLAFAGALSASPAVAALLQPSDLTYQGAFLLPTTTFFEATGSLGYPLTSGMTFNPSGNGGIGSIFMIGRGGRVAEITIPTPKLSNLDTATVLQSNPAPFSYGAAGDNDATAGIAYMTARGSQTSPKLYFGSFEYYNVDVSDYNSLGWADTNLSIPNSTGLWHVGPNTADQSSWSIGPKHGEYLFSTPQSWADTYTQGRSLLIGRMREGGNSGGSKGPVLTAVAPWASGNPPAPGVALPATPLLSFGGGDWTSWRTIGDPEWTYFSSGDRVTGGAFIDRGGKRAIVLGMRHGTFDNCPVLPTYGSDGSHGGFCLPTNDPEYGTEPYCYGDAGTECPWGVTVTSYKGYANGPYFARLVFIDIADVESVAQGSRVPQSVNGYAVYNLMDDFGTPAGTQVDRDGSNDVVGVAYDETNGRLYVGQSNGNDPNGHPNPAYPVIHVYAVNSGPDTTPPTITSVTSTTPDGAYKQGSAVNITVNFSEAVTSTGNVTVTLETGTTDRTCTFTVTNSTTGSCTYTVQAGDTTNDLTTSSITGTLADQASNALTNFTPATTLAQSKALIIDTTAPTNQDTVFPANQTKGGSTTVTLTSANETNGFVWFAPFGTTTFTEGQTMTKASGTGTTLLAPNAIGTYRLFVIDAAGNVSNPSSAILTVDSLAAYQTLTQDGSTPATVKSSATTLTTASFTPPAGSVLYVLIATQRPITTITDNRSTHLTYTGRGSYGNATSDTIASLYTAPVTTSQAMTVSVTQTAGDLAFLKVLVMTGADTTTPVGAVTGGRGTTGTITDTYTSTVDTSLGWLLYADWAQQAVPTPGTNQTLVDSYTVAGEDTYALIKRNTTTPSAGSSVTLSTTAPTSGAQIAHLTFEMRPALASGDTTAPSAPTGLGVN